MVKAVIFDLDDTLISERQYMESGFRHIAKLISNKYAKNDRELYTLLIKLFSNSPKNVFNRLLNKLGISYTQEIIVWLVEEYRSHLPSISFFDDVSPCLKFLKKERLKVGIITDGYAITQRKKLDVLGAYNFCDEIIITDELGRGYWKPHPKSFEVMKEKLKINFSEMMYVGDNPEKDFYVSSLYPIKTVRIYREGTYKDSMYLDGIKESYSINSLCEIIEIINKN